MSANTDFSVNLHLFSVNSCVCMQGRREVGGGRGQIFLGATISKFFPEKNFFGQQQPPPVDNFLGFPDEYVVIAFQRLYLNFSYQISVLCAEIFHPKKLLGPNKKFLGVFFSGFSLGSVFAEKIEFS